jgi:hypothetical protein
MSSSYRVDDCQMCGAYDHTAPKCPKVSALQQPQVSVAQAAQSQSTAEDLEKVAEDLYKQFNLLSKADLKIVAQDLYRQFDLLPIEPPQLCGQEISPPQSWGGGQRRHEIVEPPKLGEGQRRHEISPPQLGGGQRRHEISPPQFGGSTRRQEICEPQLGEGMKLLSTGEGMKLLSTGPPKLGEGMNAINLLSTDPLR